jgi:hypothetical protein
MPRLSRASTSFAQQDQIRTREARQAFLVFDQEDRALTDEIRAVRRNQWQSPLSLSPEAFAVATTAAHLRC